MYVISNNDHCCVLLNSSQAKKPAKYIRTTKRVVNNIRKNQVLLDLAKQDWNAVLSATTVHSKVEALHHIINQILDKHCPFKTVKLRSDQLGWMTNRLRNLIESRDRASRKKKRTPKCKGR